MIASDLHRRAFTRFASGTGLLVLAALAGCGGESHNETRLTDFTRIHVAAPITLRLSQGEHAAVRVSGSGAAADGLSTEVDADELVLALPRDLWGDAGDVVVDVTLRDLDELYANTAVDVAARSLTLDRLVVEADGRLAFEDLTAEELTIISGGVIDVTVHGEVAHQLIDLEGASRYDASEVRSRTGQVRLVGSSDVKLWVEDTLDVRIDGPARLTYRGDPFVARDIDGPGEAVPAS